MVFPRWLLMAAFLGTETVSGNAQTADFVPLPILLPISDANPAIREEREILVPAGFVAARVRGKLVLCQAAGPLEPLKLKVGKKMVLGMSTKTYVYPEGKPRPKNPLRETQGGLLQKPQPLNMAFLPLDPGWFTDLDGALRPGTRCMIEVSCEIFETDIPSQHAWSPQSGKYKVLWQTTLRQTIEEKDRLPASIQKVLDNAPEPQPIPPPLSPSK